MPEYNTGQPNCQSKTQGETVNHQIYPNTRSVRRDDVMAVLTKYSLIFNCPIEANYARNWEQTPQESDDGRLYIHILASPSTTKTSRLHMLYGHTVSNVLKMDSTGSNLTLYDESNVAIAEYVDKNLYILIDFNEIPGDIMAEVLDKIFDDLNQNLKTYNTPGQAARRLQQIFNLSGTNSQSSSTAELKQLDQDLADLRTEMIKKMAKHRLITSRLSIALETEKNFTENMAMEMYNALEAIGNGQEISVTGNEIHVPLGEIKINHQGNIYLIGDTILVINTNINGGGIRCINRPGSTNGHPHPFADQKGHVYLGPIADSVAKLIGEMDILTTALIVIEYLKNYNESEARLTIDHWPTVT